MENVRWRKWPTCPECKSEAYSCCNEVLLLECNNLSCSVIGFEVDADGNVLNVWHALKVKTASAPENTLSVLDIDLELTEVSARADEILGNWKREDAKYKRSKNLEF